MVNQNQLTLLGSKYNLLCLILCNTVVSRMFYPPFVHLPYSRTAPQSLITSTIIAMINQRARAFIICSITNYIIEANQAYNSSSAETHDLKFVKVSVGQQVSPFYIFILDRAPHYPC